MLYETGQKIYAHNSVSGTLGALYPPTPSNVPGTFFVALGFLPGKEVKAAKIGNLGLQDREHAHLQFLFS